MYRQYENPNDLQKRLNSLLHLFEENDDAERAIDLHEEIEELRERINFAWQDIESEEN